MWTWLQLRDSAPEKKICKGFPPTLNIGEGHPKQIQNGGGCEERKNQVRLGVEMEIVELEMMKWLLHNRGTGSSPAQTQTRGARASAPENKMQGFPPASQFAGEGSHITIKSENG